MVVFTCNHCGETLQKPKVAKHYEFQCRTAPFLTCVDCLKDFRGEEYVTHTKCITEAERYGGKDYVPKPGAYKGERKQQEWINVINNILNDEINLPKAEQNFLHILSKHENIPRRKVKFLNFVKSIVGQKINPMVIDSVWSKMETAYKSNVQNQQENGKINKKIDDGKDIKVHQENNVIENQNNENMDRENQNEDENKNHELSNTQNGTSDNQVNSVKKKKSKKRAVSEMIQEQTEEPVINKKSKHTPTEELSSAKNSEDTSFFDLSNNQSNDTVEKSAFNWKDVILDIVKSKGEISLKKLQKKVISQYIHSCSNTVTHEKASSKFNKKLKKVSEILISDEKVCLA